MFRLHLPNDASLGFANYQNAEGHEVVIPPEYTVDQTVLAKVKDQSPRFFHNDDGRVRRLTTSQGRAGQRDV